MYKAIDNSLFMTDRAKYNVIRKHAISFNSNYTGSNIIQDDIFHIVENYVRQHDMQMEMFRFPLGDDELCACTFIRSGRIFVVVNTDMPLSKQIFATAHELYHLYNYFENTDLGNLSRPSILDASTIDEETTKAEDMEANAFAGAVLAPGISILEQMRIFQIQADLIGIKEILMLMEIYAIPFKAMVLRLFEEGIILEEQIRMLFHYSSSDIRHKSELSGRAMRWQRKTPDIIVLGSLPENMERVAELDAVNDERHQKDIDYLKHIRETLINSR